MDESSVLKQFLAAMTCNLLTASYGSACAWAGPNFLVLLSNDSPLQSGPLSMSEASMVVSLPCFGAIIATVFFTFIIDRISRKMLLIFIAIPELLCWTAMLLATNVYHLYAIRIVMGFCGAGCYITVPVFVSEIAADKVRGTLNSMLILSCNAGVLFGFVIAGFADYNMQLKINIALPILFLAAFNYFPETPEFLLKRNQKIAAEKSKNFYNGFKNAPPVEMKSMVQQEKIYEKIENENESTGLSLSDFTHPAAKKAIVIALFLGALNQFCGAFSMTSFSNKIFEDAGSTLPSNTASTIVACVQLFANCVTLVLVDRAGRKSLITISASGCAIGLICMGVYDLHKEQLTAYTWISIASFSMIIFMASIGMLPLTYVILSEILPKKIKNIVILCALEVMWTLAFILLSFYPTMTAQFGTYNCMFMFASCCTVGTIFYLTVLPETKGKSYDEIIRALEK